MPLPLPIPFPHPSLTLGTDILHIPRLQRLLSKSSARYLHPFLLRVLTPRERSSARFKRGLDAYLARGVNHAQRAPHEVDPFARWVGGRWAAKEAAFKALGAAVTPGEKKGQWGWHDVEVCVASGDDTEGGAPYLVIYDPVETEPTRIVPPRRIETGFDRLEMEAERGREWGGFSRGVGADRVDGEEAERVRREKRGRVARLSISHDGEYATAVALVAS